MPITAVNTGDEIINDKVMNTFSRSAANFRTLFATISSSFLLGFCSIWRYKLICKMRTSGVILHYTKSNGGMMGHWKTCQYISHYCPLCPVKSGLQLEPFMKKNPTRCNNVSKFYYSLFIWSSTCFGRHAAHHQEPKTALAASGFSYVEGCWTLSGTVQALCLTTSTNHTPNNLPRMKNQRLPVQF